jgi:hypothetical protein
VTDPSYPLTLALDLPGELAPGEAIDVVLRVRNDTPRTVELGLRGRDPTFDVVVADAGGRIVWRRLEGAALLAILRLRPLAPGEEMVLRARWDGRMRDGVQAPAGEYAVQALLHTDEAVPLSTRPVPLRLR